MFVYIPKQFDLVNLNSSRLKKKFPVSHIDKIQTGTSR